MAINNAPRLSAATDEAQVFTAVRALIERGVDAVLSDAAFGQWALQLLRWQRARCLGLDKALAAIELKGPAETMDSIVGLPTDVMKIARIATFDPSLSVRVFRSSGTTRETRSEHHFATLELYERSAVLSAAQWLLPQPQYHCVFLAESDADAPDSSLSAMLAMFARRWSAQGQPNPWCVRNRQLDRALIDEHRHYIATSRGKSLPIAMLGASFAFVHLIDQQGAWRLAPGSVVMPTGGFKGRSRELDPSEFLQLLEQQLGVERSQVVQEYGMTELSSQAYERSGGKHARYVTPPWMRVDAVDPRDLRVLPVGQEGILRVIDLANVGSCVAIQTLDLGTRYEDGFVVRGRLPGATPRGCARAIDALLAGDA
jgi:hypothetical protein